MPIIYVKVSGKHLKYSAYYVGYSLDVIKEEAHFNLTDLPLDFEEIAPENIPANRAVCPAGLSRDDARVLMLRFNGS